MEIGKTPFEGFHPFWFWNGNINEDEIRFQIKEMAEQGIRGFFVHSRQGLKIPYLSEQYFSLIKTTVEEAEKYGLAVHIYDEYPYPSGVAGGSVVLGNPSFMGTKLDYHEYILDGGDVDLFLTPGHVLNCTAFPMKGDTPLWSEGKDCLASVGMILQSGTYHESGLTSYNGTRFLAAEPTPCLHIKLSEGRYLLSVSVQVLIEDNKYWGFYIDALNAMAVREFIRLTHERYRTHLGNYFGTRIFSVFTDEIEPGWSPLLPKAFEKKYNYCLSSSLPALSNQKHPEHQRVSRDFTRLQNELFIRNFERPISAWCAANGLAYCGEKPVRTLSQLRYMDIPGCEPGHTKAGEALDLLGPQIRGNAKCVASAAYFYRKKGSLCECFHSIGWSGNLQDEKVIAEGLVLLGITMLVPHGYFYHTGGLTRHDAPPSFFYQMPYWPLTAHLTQRIDTLLSLFAGTVLQASLWVLEPSEFLPSQEVRREYQRLINLLMGIHVEFLMVDTAILRKVSKFPPLIVIPSLEDSEEELVSVIEYLKERGTQVYHYRTNLTEQENLEAILGFVQPSLKIRGSGSEAIWCCERRKGRQGLWFLLNTSPKKLEVEIAAPESVVEYPLDQCQPVLIQQATTCFRRTLAPFESLLIKSDSRSGVKLPQRNRFILTIPEQLTLRPKNPNFYLLDRWEMEVRDRDGKVLGTCRTSPKPLVNQIADGNIPYEPVYRCGFGREPELAFPNLSVHYRHSFINDYSESVYLVREEGALSGTWEITLNGRILPPESWEAYEDFIRGSLAWDITHLLVRGANEICINLINHKIDDGLISPLYLCGAFGVDLKEGSLVKPKKTGSFENYEENLLPYFSGRMSYEFDFDFSQRDVCDSIEVAFPEFFRDAAELWINGGPALPLPYQPYCTAIPTGLIKPGLNHVELRVYTSLIRTYEGKYFDQAEHRSKNIRTEG